jgi:fibronectin-binding autotransporter adhesin
VQFPACAADEPGRRIARLGESRAPCAFILLGIACLGAFLFAASPALARCSPTAAANTPIAGTIVTCNNATSNANSPNGYGDGTQNGLIITVNPLASVTGNNDGFLLNDANGLTNNGTITGTGNNGVEAVGSITVINNMAGLISGASGVNNTGIAAGTTANVTNSGAISGSGSLADAIFAPTVMLTNNLGATITSTNTNLAVNSAAVQGDNITVTLNAGTITAIKGTAIDASTSVVVTSNTGNITGSGGAIATDNPGSTINLTNSGTVSSTDANSFAIAGAGAVTVTNTAPGSITGGFEGISGITTANVTNSGTISGAALGILASSGAGNALVLNNNSGGMVQATGSGLSGAPLAASTAVSTNGTLTVVNAGTIRGVTGIFSANPSGTGSSVENSGTITATGVNTLGTTTAIRLLNGNNTVQLDPGSTITGAVVVGLPSPPGPVSNDRLILGGVGADTFNVSNIGALNSAQQYQGFDTFQKTGASTWTLTGTGAQDWTIFQGALAVGAITALGSGNSITVSGGELRSLVTGTTQSLIISDANKTNIVSAAIGQTLTLDGQFNIVTNVNSFTYGANSVTQFGSPSNTGTVVVAGNSNSVDPTAEVVVAFGTLRAGNGLLSDALSFTLSTTVNAGATLDFNDQFAVVHNLLGAGNVIIGTNPASTLFLLSGDQINNAFSTHLFSGVISGAGGVETGPVGPAGGETILTGANTYTGGTQIQDTSILQLGNGGASGSILGDVAFLTPGINGPNPALLVFDRSDGYTFAGNISGPGNVNQAGTGTTVLTGVDTYTGPTDVQAGTLAVNGSLTGSNVTVENGATLRGTGTIAGSVTVASGGGLAPGGVASPGTLAVGTLTLNAGSLLAYRLGTQGVVGGPTNDLTHVTNALTLAGTLNVTDSGGFSLGVYRLFDYGGAFTDNGLAIGSLPGIFTGQEQTAIPGEVNLVVSGPGALVQFWDGATTTGDGTIHGGTGTWNNAATNWTSASGAINASWQGGFGVFAGAAGTVTVPVSVAYQGLQFSTDGYLVAATGAGALTPTGQAPIRVDAGVTATISAPITGAGGVAKTDPGTLILSGTNTYTGGTSIAGGTLAVAADNNLGAASGNLAFTGAGTLRFLSSFTSNRNIVLNAAGAFDTNGNNDTLSGPITGAGGFAKLGAGTLMLTGASSYSGATLVNAGTLQAGIANAFSASSAFTVASGAVIDLNNLAQSIGSLAGAGKVTLGSATLTTGLDATNTSFSGTISGTGGLIKTGAGTFTLSGVNTYAGGTNVQAGTLAITNANAVGPGALALQNGTTFDLVGSFTFANAITIARDPTFEVDGADVSTISGVIADGALPGTLEKTGTGTLILSAANTYTDQTTVNAGTLAVTGSIVSRFVDVDNGGTLGGSGKIAGIVSVRSGGTIAPGVLAPFTTLNISGGASNVIFAAGSNFLVNINAAGQTDKLLVGGPVVLQGGMVQVIAANGIYSPLSRYTILTSNVGVNGTFAQLTTTSNLAFLTPLLSYDANDVFLGFAQSANFPSVAVTRNQAATAAALQALGLGNPLFNTVVGQSAAGARQAFDALSGEMHASAVTAALEDSRLPREAILDRLNQPADVPALGAASTMTGAYAADLPSGKGPALAPVEVRMYQPRVFGLWGHGFGDWGHTHTDGNAASLSRSTGGFVLGADATQNLWNGIFRLGLAGGYTNDSLNVRARLSSGTFESVFGGLYGGASFGAIQLRAGALYGANSTSTTRSILFPGFEDAAGSRYDGSTAQAFAEAGYRIGFNVGGFGLSRASLEPFVGAAAIHIHQNGFVEAGGVAALIGFGRSYDLATMTVGLRAETTFAGSLPITARALLGWRHAYGDVVPTALMAFQGGTQAFSIAGVPIDRDAFVAEAGLDYTVSSMVTVGVSYSGQYGKRATDSAFKGHLDVSFW